MLQNKDKDFIAQSKFSCCDRLGTFRCGCFNVKRIEEAAQQIKLGPTLFLLQTKALAWFFFILTIINLPLLAIYFLGNDNDVSPVMSTNIFFKFSLGHIHHDTITCSESTLTQTNMDYNINCKNGHIAAILASGYVNDTNFRCS